MKKPDDEPTTLRVEIAVDWLRGPLRGLVDDTAGRRCDCVLGFQFCFSSCPRIPDNDNDATGFK